MLMIALVLVALAVVAAHSYLLWINSHWKRRGVKQVEPKLLVGNTGVKGGKRGIWSIMRDIYNAYPTEPWVGMYNYVSPMLMVRDPDVVTSILTTHFPSIHDNDFQIDDDIDPIAARDPFFVTGDQWKKRRTVFTSQFTPAKLKALLPNVLGICKEMNEYIAAKAGTGEGIEVKETFSKYMIDISAAMGCGIRAGCFQNEYAFFRVFARKVLNTPAFGVIYQLLVTVVPKLSSYVFRMRVVSKEAEQMIKGVIKEQKALRLKNGPSGSDILSSLIAKQEKGELMTDDDLAGYVSLFFIDGFEAPSTGLAFALLEIARNAEIQRAVRDEINEHFPGESELTFEGILELTYLDQVICEVFRLHPVGSYSTKRVTKPITLTSKAGNSISLKVGDKLLLPSDALSHDPEYFPDPDNFDPSRFSEGQLTWPEGAYLPFGAGPRQCPGKKMATVVTKAALISILRNFRLEVGSGMEYPPKVVPSIPFLILAEGIWVRFVKI